MGCGFEGSGEIVELGEGVPAKMLGKKVSFSMDPYSKNYTGMWREQVLAPANAVIPYPDSVSYDTICGAYVNPLTACGFMQITHDSGTPVLIQDAACSSLGKIVNKLAAQEGITVINIVR